MKKLVEEFNSVTAAEWKNQIIKDLKGEAYESLVWENENGISIQPFYTAENLKQVYEPAFTHSDWELSVKAATTNNKDLNLQLLNSLDHGASSFYMKVASQDLNVALRAVKLNYIHSAFEINKSNVNQLRSYFENNYDLDKVQSSVIFENFEQIHSIEEWYRTISFFLPFRKMKAIGFNALSYHNLNAHAYYEVAVIFSAIIEQLECLREKGELVNSDIVVKTGVNSDYFTQIAKLRAIRRLWNCIRKEYQLSNQIHLIVESSLTNKTIHDKHNNLLRSSVEAIAAVAGGCNELIITNFDVFHPEKTAAASRLALNQQLILKHESYLDKMADVSCGSYYIETLTDAIASKALETIKYFEEQGGFLKCVSKHIFQTEILAQAEVKKQRAVLNKQVIIGVNKFKNEKEKINMDELLLSQLSQLPISNPALSIELENLRNHA